MLEVILTLGWLSCVTGVAGNILIILTLLTQPTLRSLHNLYIGNLAVADLAVVGYCVPFWLLDLSLGHHPVVNHQHCITNAFLLVFCTFSSIFTLVFISFNRYINVCHGSVYNRLFSKTGTVLSCVAIWIVSAAEGLLPVFRIGGAFYTYRNKTHLCTFYGTSNPLNGFIILSVINVVVSTVLVGFFSLAIFRHWRKSRNRISQWVQNQSEMSKAQPGLSPADIALIRSLVLVFVLLIVLCVPLAAAVAIMGNVPMSADVFCFLIFLFFINNSINWILYGALNKNFRKGYKQLLTSGCCLTTGSAQ
ncbi:melatonin receptor type 1B-like [Babylonia areolata]|uniref:melatonin receptor type 1B-like n=1 Tax=Babylonia areolata TaxID=304850 RepID=UPI003FD68BAC